jgi:hypothetical protein
VPTHPPPPPPPQHTHVQSGDVRVWDLYSMTSVVSASLRSAYDSLDRPTGVCVCVSVCVCVCVTVCLCVCVCAVLCHTSPMLIEQM